MLLKKIITTFLIAAVFFGTFKEVVSYLSFQINQKYIAQNLCVNRNQAESMCHGKCMLKK